LPLKLLLLAQIYAPNHLSAGALPQTHWGSIHRLPRPLAGLEVGPTGNVRKEGGEGRDGKGGEGVPECQNPELASLYRPYSDVFTAVQLKYLLKADNLTTHYLWA